VKQTQDNLYLSLTTPLAKDTLRLARLHGEEALSQPFHFNLELRTEQRNLDVSQLLGKGACINLTLPGGATRCLHGLVTRFAQAGTLGDSTVCFAELRPWLWLLTLTRDSRVFQNKSVPDIVEEVFTGMGFHDYRLALSGTYAAREYCVQYQESAFDFVSRLFEDEGISYFFEHEAERHVLVLADDESAYLPCPGLETVRMETNLPSVRPDDVVTACTLEQQVTPSAYLMGDFNFETPATPLRAEVSGASPPLRIYEYPGGFMRSAAGERRAERRLEACEASARMLSGEGRVRAFASGHRFTLAGHPRVDVNGDYVLRRIHHAASLEQYTNRFEAFPAHTPFRPPRVTPLPLIPGIQSARVVGKDGEEIWTDQYGRVKVQFPWDLRGGNNESSSCWIRVAQGLAGKGWGSLFLPRMGQEVIVTFLEGNPDRPLVTGTVYNGEQPVPYALPDAQTRSVIKTSSSKGGAGSNELRFEDKASSEEIYLHAQKDLSVAVEHDRNTRVMNDDVTEVKNKRTATITNDESLTNQANYSQVVLGDYSLKVTGSLTIVAGDIKITSQADFKVDAATAVSHVAGTSLSAQAGTDVSVEAANTLTQTAGSELSQTAGTALSVQAGSDVSIQAANNLMQMAGNAVATQAGMAISTEAGNAIQNKAGMAISSEAGMVIENKAGMSLSNESGLMLTNKAALMLKNEAGLMLENKSGMLLKNEAGVMLKNHAGVLLGNEAGAVQNVKAGALVSISGALVKIN